METNTPDLSNLSPLSVPTEEQLRAIADVHRTVGRPSAPQSITDLLMHPSAMKFCDEATREKLLLIREYRRFNIDTGRLNKTKDTPAADPKHPMFRTIAYLCRMMRDDADLSPTAKVTLAGRIGAMMSQIEKMIQDTQSGFVTNQLAMVKLIQGGSKKDLNASTDEQDVDKGGLEDQQLIEEAKLLGISGTELERFLMASNADGSGPFDENDSDKDEGDNDA